MASSVTDDNLTVAHHPNEQTAFIRISCRLILSSHQMPESAPKHDSKNVFLELEEFNNEAENMLLIHRMKLFTEWLHSALEQHPGREITLCRKRGSLIRKDEEVLLLGAFLVLSENRTAEDARAIFPSFANQTVRVHQGAGPVHCQASYFDAWQALEHARRLGWADWTPGADDDDQPLHVEELAHYASQANGAVHCVSPGRLYAFPNPAILPDGELWSDATSGPRARRFTAAFHAALLLDLGATAVAGHPPPGREGAALL